MIKVQLLLSVGKCAADVGALAVLFVPLAEASFIIRRPISSLLLSLSLAGCRCFLVRYLANGSAYQVAFLNTRVARRLYLVRVGPLVVYGLAIIGGLGSLLPSSCISSTRGTITLAYTCAALFNHLLLPKPLHLKILLGMRVQRLVQRNFTLGFGFVVLGSGRSWN